MLGNGLRAGAEKLEPGPGRALEHPRFEQEIGDIFHGFFPDAIFVVIPACRES
jgi:hypothetical protein